jgi:hypothetical protein
MSSGQYEIDIAIQQKLPAEDMDAVIESLMELVLEIASCLANSPIEYETGKHTTAIKTEIKPIYSMEHMGMILFGLLLEEICSGWIGGVAL